MTPRLPPWVLVVFIFFILAVQISALYWHLYFYIRWLDIPVHILGGMWIALFGLATYYASAHIKEKEHSVFFVFLFAVALTMTIGLGWELYEFGVDHAVGDTGAGLADTLLDLTNDLIGALIAALLFIRLGYHKKA
ncbi:MAG: hypothetical protein A2942_02740 [Candidatus Lloydbacteria bacterium RIFCSPLOWO2_01_FULL_50_20]|uniref:VanZ-like domain-containing protein n=1 Tax=Candidatus Lloydbacteria bacterium RIFCSPLOWO2_01_FULL_50_20 TaxID=1798665 RepID=A0A1G2DFF7_9BACT|nr:MAG: hypothetical protein A3C13_01985 [Candidatus Lloydbacteria bacterium RIFCSPHIGHO2_02_FULL_50_11]OGZ12387.1 MAG: hypothetical protein A2942_02740 [Candidatus Lloydbacteria bacterium RIFCSPLOWO2_01_FULL_50_20]